VRPSPWAREILLQIGDCGTVDYSSASAFSVICIHLAPMPWTRRDLKPIPRIAARVAGQAVRLVEAAPRLAPPRPGEIAGIVVDIGKR